MARVGLGIALMLSAAAYSAEPQPSGAAMTTKSAATAPGPARAAAKPPAKPQSTASARPDARKPLDLRIRDVREYMTTEELMGIVTAPDPDKNTIVVEGTRLLHMERIENVPPGLASLWYAARHPASAWRIFAPVVNAPALEKPSPVPPPIFRWGP